MMRASGLPASIVLFVLGLAIAFGFAGRASAQLVCEPLPFGIGDPTPVTEVVFIVDGSGSISAEDWALEKLALTSNLNDRNVFPLDGTVAVAIVQYSTVGADQGVPAPFVQNEVCLTPIASSADVLSVQTAIGRMQQIGNGTASGTAIEAAANLLFATGHPATLERRMCLLTDGIVNLGISASDAADNAEINGIDRLAIAALQDGIRFVEADAELEYFGSTFGGGQLSFATSSAEFVAVFGAACMAKPVSLTTIEINQSVQDWQDGIPLVEEKPTIARVFAEPAACLSASGLETVTTTARLSASRDGVALPGSRLPINSAVSATFDCTPANQRALPQSSLNFRLPQEWLSGDVELEFTLPSGIDCGDGLGVQESCTKSVSFEPSDFPAVTLLALPTFPSLDPRLPQPNVRPLRTPTEADLIEQEMRTKAMLPVADFTANLEYFAGVVGLTSEWRQDSLGAWKEDRVDSQVLQSLKWYFWRNHCTPTNGCTTERVHGLANHNAGIHGTSNPQGVGLSISTLGRVGAPFAVGHYRNTATHEFSHNFQVPHTTDAAQFGTTSSGNALGPCGSTALPSTDPGYSDLFFNSAFSTRDATRTTLNNTWGWRVVLGPLEPLPNPRLPDNEIWGLATNIADLEAHPGLAIADSEVDWALMSYCPRTLSRTGQLFWISSTNYRRVLGYLQTSDFDAPLVGGFPNLQDWVVASGAIDVSNGALELAPSYVLPGPGPFEVEPGDYSVELRDAGGGILESASFTPIVDETNLPEDPSVVAESSGDLTFFVTLPRPTTPVADLVVLQGTTELGRVTASASSPSITIAEPTPGAVFDGESVRFEWTASDDDGDDLHHAIDYSNDDGATWVPLAVDLVDTNFEVGREWLRAGISSRMRVTTTDGLRSTTVVSGAFSVANNAPVVVIASPEQDQAFASAQRILIQATAFDREDGRLDGTSVEWLSSRNGSLGFGAQLEIGAEELYPGEHLIVARAVDSDAAAGGSSANIFISRVPPLPAATIPDFTLRLDPLTQFINPGESATFQVIVTSLNEFADPVDLSIVDLPAGWSASFGPISVTPDAVSELTITAPATATEVGIPIIVRGTSGDLVHTTAGTADLVFGLIPECFGRIAGIVRDAETGLPIEGAESGPVFPRAVSDAAGYFTTVDLTVRDWNVQISADGYYTQPFANVPVLCDDVTLLDVALVPVLTGTLTGRVVVGIPDPEDTSAGRDVTPTDAGIAGATVSAVGYTTADADGNYLRTDMPLISGTNAPQTYHFTANADGYWSQDKTTTVNKDTPVTLDFELVERCEFILTGSGRVVDETGTPLAGIEIRWTSSPWETEFTTSNADGSFEMPQGTISSLYNNSARLVSLYVPPPPDSPINTTIRIENLQTADQCGVNRLDGYLVIIEEPFVPVEKFARFQGTARDVSTGEPIADVRVNVRPTGRYATTINTDEAGFYDTELSIGFGGDVGVQINITSHRTGVYWNTTVEEFTAVADGVYVRDLDLTPIEYISLEGVIRDRETRLPVEGLVITASRSGGPTLSDENGRYRIDDILPGDQNAPTFISISTSRIASSPAGSTIYYPEFLTRFGESGQTLIQDFDPLRQCDGGAISGVVVNAETLEPLEDAIVSTGVSNFFDLTDIDGRFRIENIPPLADNAPRQLTVRASKSGFITATRTVTIFCGAEVFLEFGSPPGGFAEIFGTITDATTGEPLEGLFVGSAFGEATTTDELGQYRLLTAPLAADGGPRVWQVSATRDLDTQSADVTVQAGTPTRQDFQFASDPVFGIDVGDESSSFDPRTRTLTSRSTLFVTNTTGQTITGPLAATIMIDHAGVEMPDAAGHDAVGNPVFLVVEPGVELEADATASIELVFTRTAPTAFLYDVQLTLGDPSVSAISAVSSLEALAVFPREADTDGDRWHDALDSCPTRPDPEQLDLDANGVGDACEDLVSSADPDPDANPDLDLTPPAAHTEWIKLSGVAPDGATTVELGEVSSSVDGAGRFEIASPMIGAADSLDLIFTDHGGEQTIRRIEIQVSPDNTTANTPADAEGL